MKQKILVVLLTASIPLVAHGQDAQNYRCSHGDLQRRVEIVYETGVAVPCEVHYYKDTEAPGERQVLWTATSQSGYCESKTREFVAKLEDWGWDCGAEEADSAPEPEADDTESLAPAEEVEPTEDQ